MADLRDKLRERKQITRPRPVRQPTPTSAWKPSDFNPKLLIAAVIVAGIAALLAVAYLAQLSAGIAGKGTKVAVWVTNDELPARHQLQDGDLSVREVPQAFLAVGYLPKSEDPSGKITLVPLAKSEVVLKTRVAIPGVLTGVTPKLRTGERGFLFVPEGAQDIPLVKPDDAVDLIATIPEPGNEKRLISTPVLQLVRVLAIGDRLSAEATASDENLPGTGAITLAVPADKIALLTILKQAGNLHCSLRAPGDTAKTTPPIPLAEIERLVMGRVAPVTLKAPPPRIVVHTQIIHDRPLRPAVQHHPRPAPRPVVHNQPRVEIYNGSQKQN